MDTLAKPNYRIYDRTGSGVTHDIDAETLDEAIEAGREWIEGGDWSGSDHDDVIARCRSIELECKVGEIVYRPARPSLSVALLASLLADPTWDDRCWQVCVSPETVETVIPLLRSETGGDWTGTETDTDGDVWLRWQAPDEAATEIDEDATDAEDKHDCAGTYTDPEPDCPVDEGWDFVSTGNAGLDEWGCRSHGGTGMTHYEVCRNTGVYRDTFDPGCQRNPDEPTETVTYRERDAASEAYVVEHHTDSDGFLPEWLATYLDRSISTRMTEAEAKGWVTYHADEDDLDADDLEHAFAALFGRRANDQERTEGLWSHLCAAVGVDD